MYCFKIDISESFFDLDNELKAICHSKDTGCIWVFRNRDDRNNFIDEPQECLRLNKKVTMKNTSVKC